LIGCALGQNHNPRPCLSSPIREAGRKFVEGKDT
jgi:hypothetical protein